tara:strand:- start:172 stop:1218 length:1047 start_codon:yes stop_codon:yes gene_type:complete
MDKKILLEDFNKIVLNKKVKWKTLRNKSFLISGANGFIATYIIHFLLFLNEKYLLNIRMILIVRDQKKLKNKFISEKNKKNLKIIEQDISKKITISPKQKIDYILHLASNASPKLFNKYPIDTILPNILGTLGLLKLSIIKKVKSFVFFSSGEIYGDHKGVLYEDKIFNFNHLKTRASYAESKKMGETLCYTFFKEKKVPIKILRLFHTYGPCMNLDDGRVMMDFVNNIINNKRIIIKSDGSQKRTFCYISDAIIGIFLILLSGKNGEAYNLANPKEFFSIRKLGYKLSALNNKIPVKISIKSNSKKKFLPFNSVRPSIKKISKLGFRPSIGIKKGFEKTIKYFYSVI